MTIQNAPASQSHIVTVEQLIREEFPEEEEFDADIVALAPLENLIDDDEQLSHTSDTSTVEVSLDIQLDIYIRENLRLRRRLERTQSDFYKTLETRDQLRKEIENWEKEFTALQLKNKTLTADLRKLELKKAKKSGTVMAHEHVFQLCLREIRKQKNRQSRA